ncbi:MAG: hypothetical protein JRH11_19305 [Deltaproteobacteria bacterium]|nr:hypothetical protein [Deltaproteobacteria bacterium]
MRFVVVAFGTLLALTACSSSSEVTQGPAPESAAEVTPPAVPEEPAPNDPTPPEPDPQIVAPCASMPAQRPEGGRLTYRHRGRDPVELRRFNLIATGDECPPDELAPHLRPILPASVCIRMEAERLDEVWATLTNARLREVQTSTIEASPHRGGRALGAIWGSEPTERCTVSDIRISQVLEPDEEFFRALVEILRRAIREAQTPRGHRVMVVPLQGMRTVQRPPTLRLRLDNGRAPGTRVRILTAAPFEDAGGLGPEVLITRVQVSEVPFREVYPTTETTAPPLDAWIEVPAESSRLVELTLDHHAPHSFGRVHRYRVVVEHEGAGEETVEVVFDDAIRHPRRP